MPITLAGRGFGQASVAIGGSEALREREEEKAHKKANCDEQGFQLHSIVRRPLYWISTFRTRGLPIARSHFVIEGLNAAHFSNGPLVRSGLPKGLPRLRHSSGNSDRSPLQTPLLATN